MKAVYRRAGWFALRGAAWLLWAPVALAIKLTHLWAVRELVSGDAISCGTCGAEIGLLGMWECGRCSYSWAGFYFARCESCGDVPPYVECGRCGASTMNPLLFG